jgi:replicative DNA helicase
VKGAGFVTGKHLLGSWADEVREGKSPRSYPVGDGELARIKLGPGRVVLIGGAPGAGKTALTVQWVVDALMATPDIRALVVNVEMGHAAILERQLARLADVDLTSIHQRQLTDEQKANVEAGMEELGRVANRLAFLSPPFNLKNIKKSTGDFKADILLVDYVQRVRGDGESGNRRAAVDEVMDTLRGLANDGGRAVLVVAAVARQKDSGGRSSYDPDVLGLASFRETSELEYGADDAFILAPDGMLDDQVVLRHLKSRYDEMHDVRLSFDRSRQRFESITTPAHTARSRDRQELDGFLQGMWDGPEDPNGG